MSRLQRTAGERDCKEKCYGCSVTRSGKGGGGGGGKGWGVGDSFVGLVVQSIITPPPPPLSKRICYFYCLCYYPAGSVFAKVCLFCFVLFYE